MILTKSQITDFESFVKKKNISTFHSIDDVFSVLDSKYTLVTNCDDLFFKASVYHNSEMMGQYIFGIWNDKYAVSISFWEDGVKIFLDSEKSYSDLRNIILKQTDGFEKYYDEKKKNFSNAISVLSNIRDKIHDSITDKNIEITTKYVGSNTIIADLNRLGKKTMYRLSFSHEGYKMTVIHNDDSQTDFDMFDEFNEFLSNLLTDLDGK